MAFPTIPTTGDGRVASLNQLDTAATLTGPNLNALTGRAAGDLVIAIAGEYQSSAAADAAFTGWAGGGLTWTEIRDSTGTADCRLGVAFARLATGSETGAVTVTRSGTLVGDASMVLLCIPGAHASTNPEATAVAVATAAAADPAALNPAGWDAEDTLWIAVCGNGMTGTGGTWTGIDGAPTNYTNLIDTNAADVAIGDFSLGVAFRQLNAASEDVGTFSQDTSNTRSAALVIAVRPLTVLANLGVAQGQATTNITLEGPANLTVQNVAQAQVVGTPDSIGSTPVHDDHTLLAGVTGLTTVQIPVPPGTAANKIVEVQVLKQNTAAFTSIPSGFVQVSQLATSESHQQTTFWKRLSAADSGTYDFSWTGASWAGGSAHLISGAALSGTPYDEPVDHEVSGTASASSPAVQLTTGGINRLLLWQAKGSNGSSNWTPPTSFTEHFQTVNFTAASLGQSAAGDTGALTGTSGNTDLKIASLIAFKPVTVAGGEDLTLTQVHNLTVQNVAQAQSTLTAGPTPTIGGTDGHVAYAGAATSVAVPVSGGAAIGKVELVRILREFAVAPSTHPALAGWVEVSYRSESQGGDTIDQTILVRKLDGSEGSTYTFTWTGTASNGATATSHAISNSDDLNLATYFEDTDHIGAATAQTAVVTTAVDTLGVNRLALWLSAGYGGSSTWTQPSGFTERTERQNMGTATLNQATAGTVTASGASNIDTDRKIAFLGAIRPAMVPITLQEETGGASDLTGLGVAQGQTSTQIALTQVHVLAGMGVAQAQATTSPTLAVEHNLTVQDVTQAQTSTQIALTQDHTLAGLGVAQAQATTSPTLAVEHNLAGLEVAQTQATTNIVLELPPSGIDVRPVMIRMISGRLFSTSTFIQVRPVPPVTTTPTLAGLGVAQGQTAQDIALVQQHTLGGLGVAQGQATTTPTLVQQHTLAGLGVSQAQATTTPTIAVQHNLTGLGISQGQASTNITLGMPGALSGLGVAQAQASTVIDLTQLHVLGGLGVAQAQASTTINLAQVHVLASLGVAQAQATTTPTIAVQHNLLGLGVAQGQAAANVALTQVHVLGGLGVAQAQATADPTLAVQHNLAGLNVGQAQASTLINLGQIHILSGLGVAQGQSSTVIGLSGQITLAGLGVAQAQATLDPVLERVYNLLGLGVAQAQATADPTLAVTHNLLGLGVAQGSTATVLVLAQIHVLVGMGVVTPQQVVAVVLGIGALPLRRAGSGKLVGNAGGGGLVSSVGSGGLTGRTGGGGR